MYDVYLYTVWPVPPENVWIFVSQFSKFLNSTSWLLRRQLGWCAISIKKAPSWGYWTFRNRPSAHVYQSRGRTVRTEKHSPDQNCMWCTEVWSSRTLAFPTLDTCENHLDWHTSIVSHSIQLSQHHHFLSSSTKNESSYKKVDLGLFWLYQLSAFCKPDIPCVSLRAISEPFRGPI